MTGGQVYKVGKFFSACGGASPNRRRFDDLVDPGIDPFCADHSAWPESARAGGSPTGAVSVNLEVPDSVTRSGVRRGRRRSRDCHATPSGNSYSAGNGDRASCPSFLGAPDASIGPDFHSRSRSSRRPPARVRLVTGSSARKSRMGAVSSVSTALLGSQFRASLSHNLRCTALESIPRVSLSATSRAGKYSQPTWRLTTSFQRPSSGRP